MAFTTYDVRVQSIPVISFIVFNAASTGPSPKPAFFISLSSIFIEIVAVGIALGISKLVIGFDLATVLLPLYGIGIILTIFSSEEFVNVAWDSAGVTTGPVTVPLVLAMGLGLGNAVSAIEGFGILSLASICPIVAVLTMGIIIQIINKSHKSQFEDEEEIS